MKRYPAGMKEWVTENYMLHDLESLTKQINERFGLDMNMKAVSSMKKRWKLAGAPRKRIYTDLWPQEICDFVEVNHKGHGRKEMVEMILKEFGRTYSVQQIKSFYHNHGLDSGLTGHFVKGQPSHNKGKKMSPEVYKKAAGTMFKKGNTPHNHVEVGTEIIDAEGYHKRKIAEPNRWEFVHKIVWRENFGEIPEGMMISFKDCNKDNLSPDNLMLITLGENGMLNTRGLRSENPEYTEAGLNVAKLYIKAKELKEGKHGKEEKGG